MLTSSSKVHQNDGFIRNGHSRSVLSQSLCLFCVNLNRAQNFIFHVLVLHFKCKANNSTFQNT